MSQYTFTGEAEETIQVLAARLGIPPKEVVRESLSLLQWLTNQVDSGASFVIRRPTKIVRLPLIGEIKGETLNELELKIFNKNREIEHE
jgi:hypothetical protein